MSGHARGHDGCAYSTHQNRRSHHGDKPAFLSLPAMRYQSAYAVLVLVSALDIVFTWGMIQLCRAQEMNPIAAAVIHARGLGGMVLFKFALILLAILLCEAVGRHNDDLGNRLSVGIVLIGAFPVLYAFASLCDILPPSMVA